MIRPLIDSVLLGADGFVACAAIGLLRLPTNGRLPLFAWFGLCDALALLAGHALHLAPGWSAAAQPAFVALWATLASLLLVFRAGPLLCLIPVLLSLDNFLAGAAGPQASLPSAAVLSCVMSATLAGIGRTAGQMLADRLPDATQGQFAGAALLLGLASTMT